MLRGQHIEELIQLLKRRDVLLYHSCQYVDFLSYLELGGIPSRHKLESEKKRFTKFDTDKMDQENDVWDKVFLNFQDFGEIFAHGRGIPTVYGPLQLEVSPEALSVADDVVVSLRSAGSKNFDRNKEALKTVEDINRIFLHSKDEPDARKRKYIKDRSLLKDAFKRDYTSNPEMNLSTLTGLIPIKYVKRIIVDNFIISADYLYNHVKKKIDRKQKRFTFTYRKYGDSCQVIINDIAKIAKAKEISLDELAKIPEINSMTKEWAAKLLTNPEMASQWVRYVKYLRNGTILPILEEQYVPSDYGLYKCTTCGKRVMGFSKEEHAKEKHEGKCGWAKIK